MIARLVMFNVVPSLYGLGGVMIATCVRVKPKKERWTKVARIAASLAVVFVGAGPLIKAIVDGPERLVGADEKAFSICLAAAWSLAVLIALVRSLRAPQISHEEFRKNKRWRFLITFFLGVLLILACGVAAWFYGRSTGLRALEKAAAEAREIIESRQQDGSPKAAAAYVALFKELDADKGLDYVWERKGQGERLPEGEYLARLVRERREMIGRIEELSSGPAPAFRLRYLGIGPDPGRGVYGGFKGAAALLTLASRGAAAEGNGARALTLCRGRLRLAEHLRQSPGWLAWMIADRVSRPEAETLGICLTAVKKAEHGELVAYARELTERRRAVPENLATATFEDSASGLIWRNELVSGAKGAHGDEDAFASALSWWVLPYYGEEFVPEILPRARRFSRALLLPERQARRSARKMEEEAEARPSFAALYLSFDAFLVHARPVNGRVDAERSLARYETACALRLHAQDKGEYPQKLSELAPKYLDASVLDMVLKARTSYERTKAGCRLAWRKWERGSEGPEPTGKPTEIILGPRPKPKKPAMKPGVRYTPRAGPLGH